MNLTSLLVFIISVFIKGNGPHIGTEKSNKIPAEAEILRKYVTNIFTSLKSDVQKPDSEVFFRALTGFFDLKASGRISKNILTIIDFSLSSRLERMWIVDLDRMEILHRNLVAHGRNSGDEFASSFSNTPQSCKSSLGFYITGNRYIGLHGMALLLEGVEQGINDLARQRTIVMHGAWYVSRDFVNRYGVLGKSFGCPAIPLEDHEKIMSILEGGSCLFISSPDKTYQASTKMFGTPDAITGMYKFMSETGADNYLDPDPVVFPSGL